MVSTLVGHDCISVTITTTPCLLLLRDDTSVKMCCAALVPQCVVSVESKSASCREAERGADTQNDVEAAGRSLALFCSPLPLVLLRGVALTQACSCTCPGTMQSRSLCTLSPGVVRVAQCDAIARFFVRIISAQPAMEGCCLPPLSSPLHHPHPPTVRCPRSSCSHRTCCPDWPRPRPLSKQCDHHVFASRLQVGSPLFNPNALVQLSRPSPHPPPSCRPRSCWLSLPSQELPKPRNPNGRIGVIGGSGLYKMSGVTDVQ
jgi:hypothetical protein